MAHYGSMKVLFLLVLLAWCDSMQSEGVDIGALLDAGGDAFRENLIFRHLPGGKLLAQFSFNIDFAANMSHPEALKHLQLFPKAISQIVRLFDVQEFLVSLTRGRWQYSEWGHPGADSGSDNAIEPVPLGAQLLAYFAGNSTDERWNGLSHSLSALLCASLNTLSDPTHRTRAPTKTFRPSSVTHSQPVTFYYGSMPREAVCTENLTPWVKLLPCRDQRGLAALLNPLKLFDSHYHSMKLHLVRDVVDYHGTIFYKLKLRQLLDVVFSLDSNTAGEWSLPSVFGRSPTNSCQLAHESTVELALPASTKGITVSPLPRGSGVVRYRYDELATSSLTVAWHDSQWPSVPFAQSAVAIARYITIGTGSERGRLVHHLTNEHDSPVKVGYHANVPWFLQLYFHTMRLSVASCTEYSNATSLFPTTAFEWYRLEPAVDHGDEAVIEFVATLPPNSVTSFTIDFDKAFLGWQEFPPDAHRGFPLAPGVVTVHAHPSDYHVYTEPLSVAMPNPDFSMPYNVMTLTSTAIVLFFGAMFKVLTKRRKELDAPSQRPTRRLVRGLWMLLTGEARQARHQQQQFTQ